MQVLDPVPSSQSSAPPEGELADLAKIAQHEWWQGSVVEAVAMGVADFGHPFVVVASQTCNVQSCDIDKVPMVELLGARQIDSSELARQYRGGAHPRILHTVAYGPDGSELALELRIEERVWVPRAQLANLHPSAYRIIDAKDDPSLRNKEVFSAWLGRSYTRVELPDAFNDLLKQTKIGDSLSRWVVGRFSDKIQGVYFQIAESSEDDSGEDVYHSPSEIACLNPPYDLAVTVVLYLEDDVADVEGALAKFNEKNIPNPVPGEERITRIAYARNLGVNLITDAVSVQSWTVDNLIHSVKYTEWDFMSTLSEDLTLSD